MLMLAVVVAAVWAPLAFGQEEAAEEAVSNEMFTVNNTWMLVSTFLVFIMHLGFATLESGLTQAKNTVNILFKNTGVVAIGLLTYAICGFNLMYPGDFNIIAGGWFGFAGFGIGEAADYVAIEYAGGNYTYWTDFIFQAMFAATAATIVSGAVAERVKLSSFLIFTVLYVGLAYPIAGSWKWGGGWLADMGFYDFAGSTLVHSVGGWGALAFVLLLGPRTGKYTAAGIRAFEGHSMPLATIGVFLLWLGWFGFNGGSVLSADPELVSLVFVTTSLAAAAGVMSAMATTWIVQKKPDLSMVLNGSLAGLVGITAGADSVSVLSSIIIGGIAGVIVVFSVLMFDKLKLDDPVGALSVHLVCGIWGTLAVGIFGPDAITDQGIGAAIMIQAIGVVAYGIFSFIVAGAITLALKLTMGIRVHEEEEAIGLDISEHGMEAYGGFQIFASK
ncbi:MAG: ammonium transporter [Candidatus Hydrogenedens sp.]|nr:ammonium transporter [Candidatus Hydrogenedens sp.]